MDQKISLNELLEAIRTQRLLMIDGRLDPTKGRAISKLFRVEGYVHNVLTGVKREERLSGKK